MPAVGFPNDALSSIKIAPFTKVSLYCDGAYGGCRFDYMGPMEIPDLGAVGFNDSMSSMQVIPLPPTIDSQIACCNGTSDAYQCGKYVPGSAACVDSMTQYCSTNLSDPKCKAWCKDNTAICDQYVQTYCDSHPSDPYCACVKSPAKGVGGINPKCIDANCLNTGYLTTAMKNTNCPSIIDCSIQTTLANTGIIFSNTTPIQQNCGNTTVVAQPGSTVVSPPNNPTTTTINQSSGSPQSQPSPGQTVVSWIYDHMILVLVFIMVVFIALFIFFGNDEEPDITDYAAAALLLPIPP